MFKLYYCEEGNNGLIFYNNELEPCLSYMKNKSLVACKCIIITPNKRCINFCDNNRMIFGPMIFN